MTVQVIIADKVGVVETPSKALKLTLAGNSTMTVVSTGHPTALTFRVRQCTDNKELWFVSALAYDCRFDYLGTIRIMRNSEPLYTIGKKSHYNHTSAQNRVFIEFFLAAKRVVSDHDSWPPGMAVTHAGRCAVCARKLTNPVSVDWGVGPECWEKTH